MSVSSDRSRILVHLHLYYEEQWGQMRACLESLGERDYDLYVTVIAENPALFKEMRSFRQDVRILVVRNLGYDVGPFFEVLSRVNLDDYGYVVKIHSKRDVAEACHINNINMSGSRWRGYLLSFLKNRAAFDRTMDAFGRDPSLGMAGCKVLISHLFTRTRSEYERWILNEAGERLVKLGITPAPSDICTFITGTMFTVRASLLKPLQSLGFGSDCFSPANRESSRDLAHVFEYLSGWLVTSSKIPGTDTHYRIDDPFSAMSTRMLWASARYFRKLRRFVFRVQQDHERGITKVKILKITMMTFRTGKDSDSHGSSS